MIEKWRVLVLAGVYRWFGGRGGFISHFILLDKIDEQLRPPLPPNSMMEKMARFGCVASSSLIREEG